MNPRSVICLGLLLVGLSSASPSQSAPKLEQILPRVQEHVKEFEHSLPDFICDEKITSRELMGGKTIHETDIGMQSSLPKIPSISTTKSSGLRKLMKMSRW
jgi:hypothetical protein